MTSGDGGSGSVDVTAAFHWTLHLFAVQGFLFFAVVTQTKSQEPGAHGGVARYFGTAFLFQSLSSFLLALASQLYPGSVSSSLGVCAALCTSIVPVSLIAAATHVAVPEPRHSLLKTLSFMLWIALLLLCTVLWSKNVQAIPDFPAVSSHIRRQLAGGLAGGILSVLVACFIRIGRTRKGRNGAFVLMLGCAVVSIAGMCWLHLKPFCDASSTTNWSSSCPMPRMLDPNTLMVLILFVGNVLGAEGVLRLMAVGTGDGSTDGYSEILP